MGRHHLHCVVLACGMGDQVRPLYETEAHLEKERSLALFFEQTYQCRLHKMPIRYHLDFAVEQDGKIRAFLEIKTTRYSLQEHKAYGGLKLSFAKWCAAEKLCGVGNVSFILLVGFPDAPRYLRTDDFRHDGLVWWGRADRGDAQDMEPAVNLSVERFVMMR